MSFRNALAACTVFLVSISSWASSVSSLKGTRAIIDLEGSFVSVGDQFFLINPATGKKAAIVQIQQIKNDKALALILKGKGQVGYTLQAKSSGLTGAPSSSETATEATAPSANIAASGKNSGSRAQYGYLLGYLQNKMDASIAYSTGVGNSSTTQVGMTGSGFSLGGFYDYEFSKNLYLQGIAAYEQFSVKGTAAALACRGSATCEANINYLSFYGIFKYYVGDTGPRPWWLGGGGAYMMALSKSASALNESDISVNQALTLGGGMDFSISNNRYIPVSLQYNYFPDSPTVKASSLVIRVGYSYGQ